MLTKRSIGMSLIAMALLAAVAFPGQVRADDKIVLKGVTPWPLAYYWCEPFIRFQKMVNERLAGKVELTYLGGSEVTPPFEQFEALRNGNFDVILGAASYYTGTVPEASAVLYTKLPPSKLRENGYYDLMRDLHRTKGDVVYLANVGGGVDKAFRIFLKDKRDKPDFSGLKIRVTPVYVELVKALGGTPIVMKPGEVYTAMERGVVDGYGWSYGGIMDFGWHEVTKYVIDHGFYSANTSILFNGDSWDKLPQDVRDELEKIGQELEVWADQFMADYNSKEDEKLKAAGLSFIKYSADDESMYLSTAYEQGWKEYLAKHPDVGDKVKSLSE